MDVLAVNCDKQRRPIASSNREAGLVPYYGASGIVDYVKDYLFDGEYLLVSEDGANLVTRNTPIAFSITGRNWVNNHAHVLKFESDVERKFVEIYLNSIDLSPWITGGAQPKLNKKNLNQIPIPFPSENELVRIVSLMEEYNTVFGDFIRNMQREIELRTNQYNYYRDKILSF